ncbi:MAG: SPFH domain-containing protein [Patescibacteria group bacterium]|nr:SPFH domain-containing protein [Patescibacteria group bacterium]
MSLLNVLFFLAAVAVLAYYVLGVTGASVNRKPIGPTTKKTRNLLLVLGVVLLFISLGVKTVSSDSRGLRFNFGAISSQSLEPGLHFNWPIMQTIKTVSIQPLEIKTDIPVDGSGAITKDNQTIGAQLTLFYVYDQEKLPLMWKDFGEEKLRTILSKSMTESFKAQVGKYDIFVLPMSQDTIRLQTLRQIKNMMAAYPLFVTELKITNYDWSDDFDAQIKETMNRSQQVKQKEQELLITEQEAQKKVKNAEAEKTALVTAAEGKKIAAGLEAEAKALEGEGIRKYNEAVAKNMALEIQLRQLDIERIKAERWDGKYVPTNNYGPIPVETGHLQPQSPSR